MNPPSLTRLPDLAANRRDNLVDRGSVMRLGPIYDQRKALDNRAILHRFVSIAQRSLTEMFRVFLGLCVSLLRTGNASADGSEVNVFPYGHPSG